MAFALLKVGQNRYWCPRSMGPTIILQGAAWHSGQRPAVAGRQLRAGSWDAAHSSQLHCRGGGEVRGWGWVGVVQVHVVTVEKLETFKKMGDTWWWVIRSTMGSSGSTRGFSGSTMGSSGSTVCPSGSTMGLSRPSPSVT